METVGSIPRPGLKAHVDFAVSFSCLDVPNPILKQGWALWGRCGWEQNRAAVLRVSAKSLKILDSTFL